MSELLRLTVQDVIWTHFQLTRRVEPFRYAAVEEATFAQYSYGGPAAPAEAAARLLDEIVRKRPFATGNEALAFVAPLAFLRLNGVDFSVADVDALPWFVQTIAEEGSSLERFRAACSAVRGHGDAATRGNEGSRPGGATSAPVQEGVDVANAEGAYDLSEAAPQPPEAGAHGLGEPVQEAVRSVLCDYPSTVNGLLASGGAS